MALSVMKDFLFGQQLYKFTFTNHARLSMTRVFPLPFDSSLQEIPNSQKTLL